MSNTFRSVCNKQGPINCLLEFFFLDDGASDLVIIDKVKLAGLMVSCYRACFRLFDGGAGGACGCVGCCAHQSRARFEARTEGGRSVIAANYPE